MIMKDFLNAIRIMLSVVFVIFAGLTVWWATDHFSVGEDYDAVLGFGTMAASFALLFWRDITQIFEWIFEWFD